MECDCRRRNATILSNNFNRVEINFVWKQSKKNGYGRVITGWCHIFRVRGIGGTNFTQGKFRSKDSSERATGMSLLLLPWPLDGYWGGVCCWAVSTGLVGSMEWAKWNENMQQQQKKKKKRRGPIMPQPRCDHRDNSTQFSVAARDSPPPLSCWWFVRDSGFE